MATDMILAMTGAEIAGISCLPSKIGWMACHFSPYSTGLSNRPLRLPPDSILILNDITPPHGHDKQLIAAQLQECAEQFQCRGILLDFQRPDCAETAELSAFLHQTLPCPVAVSEYYGAKLDCPIFLAPLPHHISLQEYIFPWKNREIWLELALDAEEIRLTEAGASIVPLPCLPQINGFSEEALHCHYRAELSEDSAVFSLWRTRDDIGALLQEADSLGIITAVGLYQEFRQTQKPPVDTTGGLEQKQKRDV